MTSLCVTFLRTSSISTRSNDPLKQFRIVSSETPCFNNAFLTDLGTRIVSDGKTAAEKKRKRAHPKRIEISRLVTAVSAFHVSSLLSQPPHDRLLLLTPIPVSPFTSRFAMPRNPLTVKLRLKLRGNYPVSGNPAPFRIPVPGNPFGVGMRINDRAPVGGNPPVFSPVRRHPFFSWRNIHDLFPMILNPGIRGIRRRSRNKLPPTFDFDPHLAGRRRRGRPGTLGSIK